MTTAPPHQAQGDYPELSAAIKFVQDYDASVWKNPGDRHVADMVCATIIADLQRRIARLPPRSPQGDYPVLPEPVYFRVGKSTHAYFTISDLRAYVDADRAARSGQVSDEPVGEMAGHLEVGFAARVPIIRWKDGYWPAVGTKLYTRPGPSKEVVEALEKCVHGLDHLDRLCREWEPDYASGDDRAKWVHARDAANLARAALRSLGGEQK